MPYVMVFLSLFYISLPTSLEDEIDEASVARAFRRSFTGTVTLSFSCLAL